MDNENETRPLLHSFQSETWRSRARKRCMRIPSEITITGIILGLFLIVVTLLIVLENMESDKKQKNISLNDNLLASPMKYNKKADDHSWQDKKDYSKFKNAQMEEKNKKWDKVNKGWKQHPNIPASPMKFSIQKDPLWQNKRDYYMKLKQDRVAAKWDKVNKGWKKIPDILASSMKSHKNEDPLWQDKRDYYMKLKDEKVEEKNRKWDKVNKGWKKLPEISVGNIHDNDYEENQKNDDVEPMIITDSSAEYGKEVDDSLEAFASLRMSGMGDPSEMIKFRQQVLEVKNLLHSNINWKIIDDGWKALSEQGWRDHDIRRALMMALNEKRQELRRAQLENMLQSPMNVDDIWDQINDSWKKNLYGGWKNKDIEEKSFKAWKEQKNEMQSPQAPLNIQDLWVKATDFLRNLFNKGMNNQKSQMETNDEWAKKFNFLQSSSKKKKENDEKKDKHSKDVWKDKNTDESDDEVEEPEESPELQMNFDDFSNIIQALKDRQKGMDDQKSQMEINDEFVNLLQSSYKKWKKNKDYKKKHPKDEMKDNSTDEMENDNDQIQKSPVSFEDFIEVIEAIREKGKKEAEKQKNINDEMKNEMGTLYSSKPTDKRWKQIDDHFKTLIEYERNTFFGRKDGGDTTSSPEDISLQKSMPFVYGKQDKMGKEWQKVPNQSLKEKDLKEAVYKAWKEGDKLRNSAFGHSDYKWKKVNNGWKTIANKS